MFKELVQSLRFFLTLTLLTGLIYPLCMTSLGQALWPEKVNGSLLFKDGKLIGSELLAQKFSSDRYFHPRDSASDFSASPSGASNLAPTSAVFKNALAKRLEAYGSQAPSDLLTASGSGLDPHLSPASVFLQVERVARSRGLSDKDQEALKKLIDKFTEDPSFGFMGLRRVNILKLNLALEEHFHE